MVEYEKTSDIFIIGNDDKFLCSHTDQESYVWRNNLNANIYENVQMN